MAKKYNTKRNNILLQIQINFRHIYNRWSILIIQYKSTLSLHLLYMNIWLYMDIWYYPIFYIYIYIYICICMYIWTLYFFCLLQHCRNTYTRWSHWFHIHTIFSSCSYLIIVTRKNSLPNFEHDPSYQ